MLVVPVVGVLGSRDFIDEILLIAWRPILEVLSLVLLVASYTTVVFADCSFTTNVPNESLRP